MIDIISGFSKIHIPIRGLQFPVNAWTLLVSSVLELERPLVVAGTSNKYERVYLQIRVNLRYLCWFLSST